MTNPLEQGVPCIFQEGEGVSSPLVRHQTAAPGIALQEQDGAGNLSEERIAIEVTVQITDPPLSVEIDCMWIEQVK